MGEESVQWDEEVLMSFWTRLFGAREKAAGTELQLSFPYEIVTVAGAEAIGALAELRTPEHTPIIVGEPGNLPYLHDLLEQDPHTLEEVQQRVRSIGSPEWWFTARLHALEESFADALGEWPDVLTPFDTVQAVLDPASGQPLAAVCIALLPTAASWDAPALLRFGGGEIHPFPEEHTAIARAWSEQYGAEIIAATPDTLEFAVGRPPATHETAEELAMNQFAYCEDIVRQGTGSIRALAACLLNAPYWFFRWERDR